MVGKDQQHLGDAGEEFRKVMYVKARVSNLTRIIGDDQSWIINPFLWIEGKTDEKRNETRTKSVCEWSTAGGLYIDLYS